MSYAKRMRKFPTGDLALRELAQGTNGQLIVGQTGAAPAYKTVSGHATLANDGTLTLNPLLMAYVDVTVSAAEMLALNATPKTLLAAPAAGYAHVPIAIEIYKAAGTAYAGVAEGEDLAVKYTDANGATIITVETTGFLDQATAQVRYMLPAVATLTPVEAAAIVLHLLTGEITTGDTGVKVRLWYRTIPTTL